jgi:hypothetical protein
MPYIVEYDKKNKIVILQFSGDFNKKEHFSARDEASELCKENKCSKLLVDLSNLKVKNLSVFGCFEFGESVAKLFRCKKIAHVLPPDTKTKEDIDFICTVESNRFGWVEKFENMNKAIEWLIE